MTLTLRYSLPEPTAGWKVAMVSNPIVQGIVRGRMEAGMRRFARIIRSDIDSGALQDALSDGDPSAPAPPSSPPPMGFV